MMATAKFVAYYRVSSKTQGQSGLGLEAQQEAVRRHLNGGDWELVAEFTEVESGTRKGNNRPELAKALARCKKEKATLVIAKLDRLARNVYFVSGLMESGVEFKAVDIPHANKLTIHILAAVAEAEAEAISRRTKEALAAAKARGVKLGKPENLTDDGRKVGSANGGGTMKKKAVEEYEKLIGIIGSLRQKGISFDKIAAHLNEFGETTRENKPFKGMTVKRILDRASLP